MNQLEGLSSDVTKSLKDVMGCIVKRERRRLEDKMVKRLDCTSFNMDICQKAVEFLPKVVVC